MLSFLWASYGTDVGSLLLLKEEKKSQTCLGPLVTAALTRISSEDHHSAKCFNESTCCFLFRCVHSFLKRFPCAFFVSWVLHRAEFVCAVQCWKRFQLMCIWLVFSFDVSDLLESKVTGSKACNATIPCRRSYHIWTLFKKTKDLKNYNANVTVDFS